MAALSDCLSLPCAGCAEEFVLALQIPWRRAVMILGLLLCHFPRFALGQVMAWEGQELNVKFPHFILWASPFS